jgi:hypothetical protein
MILTGCTVLQVPRESVDRGDSGTFEVANSVPRVVPAPPSDDGAVLRRNALPGHPETPRSGKDP